MSQEFVNNQTQVPAIDSKYRKILIAAKRSKQIQKGAQPRVRVNGKPTRVALEEINQGLVQFELTDKAEK
jgi:DNA-directed RNA polymerase omega subunit